MGNSAHQVLRRYDHVRQRIVLALDPFEPSDHPQPRPLQTRGDDRSEATKGVITLRSAPLCEVDILVQHARRRHVVDAGIAEDVIGRVAWTYILAQFSDDEAGLALVGDLTRIAGRPSYRHVRADDRCTGLDEKQRMRRRRFAELLPKRVEVVPQGDDLGWRARALERERSARDGAAGRPRRAAHVALIFGDMGVLDRAESDPAVARPKPGPLHASVLSHK